MPGQNIGAHFRHQRISQQEKHTMIPGHCVTRRASCDFPYVASESPRKTRQVNSQWNPPQGKIKLLYAIRQQEAQQHWWYPPITLTQPESPTWDQTNPLRHHLCSTCHVLLAFCINWVSGNVHRRWLCHPVSQIPHSKVTGRWQTNSSISGLNRCINYLQCTISSWSVGSCDITLSSPASL